MKLSIIVIFFNNKREAPRTLYTLSRAYQKNIEIDYEVLAIDSNSSEPLDTKMVKSYGSEFSYHFVKTVNPSPVEALRRGLELSKGEYVMVMIDGAHILTPGVLHKWHDAIQIYPSSCVYTQRYHLGKYRQNDHVGYNQAQEDELLSNIDWKNNGYNLFNISSFRQTAEWWFSRHYESNCIVFLKERLVEYGCFDRDYFSVGGGFLNLDIFKRGVEDPRNTVVMLMGESTFHQYHGGTTTNVARDQIKLLEYRKEYFRLNGKHYSRPENINLHYFGNIDQSIEKQLVPTLHQKYYFELSKDLMFENRVDEAVFIIERATEQYPFCVFLLAQKVKIYREQGRYEEALNILNDALKVDSLDTSLLILQGDIFLQQNKIDAAIEAFEFCHSLDESDSAALIKLSKAHLKKGNRNKAQQYAQSAVDYALKLKLDEKFMSVFSYVNNFNYTSLVKQMLASEGEMESLAHNFNFRIAKVEAMEKGAEKSRLTDELVNLYDYSKVDVNQANKLAGLLIWQDKKEALWKLCEDLEQQKLTFYNHFFKSKWYLGHDQFDPCIHEIDLALPHVPTIQTKAVCYSMLAKCQFKQKHFKASLVNADKAVSINPNNPDFLFTKAKAHLGLKQDGQAKPLFERVAGISNYNLKFNALLHLFDIHFKKGNYKKCKSYLTEAAKVKPNHERIQRKQQKLVSTHK